MDATEKKRNAAKASLEFIQPGTALGVGTGSTVNCLIEMLPTVRDQIDKVVSSSKASTKLLEEQGFEVMTLNEAGDLELLCNKPGKGSLAAGGTPLTIKGAKPLPASD